MPAQPGLGIATEVMRLEAPSSWAPMSTEPTAAIPVVEPIHGHDAEDGGLARGGHALGRWPGRAGAAVDGRAPQARRLLAGPQLPRGRADLPARQPAPEGAARARAHQAAAA